METCSFKPLLDSPSPLRSTPPPPLPPPSPPPSPPPPTNPRDFWKLCLVLFWMVNAVLIGPARCPSPALPSPLCTKTYRPLPLTEKSSSPSSLPVRLAEPHQHHQHHQHQQRHQHRSRSHRPLETPDIRVSLSYGRVRRSLRTGSLRLVRCFIPV